jgi:hypothetical protein
MGIFSIFHRHHFKPTNKNSSGRLRVGGFGLEIWNIGVYMIINTETAVSSISNKVVQLSSPTPPPLPSVNSILVTTCSPERGKRVGMGKEPNHTMARTPDPL